MIIQIDEQTLILKMVESKVFLIKPKHQYHLSQRGEFVYGAQSLNQRRLLHESMFIPIDRWTLILKKRWKWSFCYGSKASIHLSQWEEWICGVQ